ncbi:hypothetical protein D6D19_09638 [Aureobasidium pullulans]|uniref:Rhodanese domain-containing protein n=1 Tax=Aureobasidium pullulans TaxID=5580 RepID=A0A4S9LBN0_AURPU|nr:hypothetical protein D6D19_09638 [Aureobasidium pullulans]THY26270.1 hypothetical protein D6D00_05729 [Aureobasidium pullulans]
MTSEQSRPWHADFPEPKAEAAIMPRNRVMQMLSLRGVASLLIIDLRRMDFEGGCLRGSLNIPAQGFWWNRGMLYELAYKADIEWVVFTCGSSNGRAPRCAAWFKEFIDAAGDEQMQSMVLEGGVKGWVKSGPQFTRLMDGYKEPYWQDLFAQEEAKKSAAQEADKSSVGQGDVTK